LPQSNYCSTHADRRPHSGSERHENFFLRNTGPPAPNRQRSLSDRGRPRETNTLQRFSYLPFRAPDNPAKSKLVGCDDPIQAPSRTCCAQCPSARTSKVAFLNSARIWYCTGPVTEFPSNACQGL